MFLQRKVYDLESLLSNSTKKGSEPEAFRLEILNCSFAHFPFMPGSPRIKFSYLCPNS
jgi:hypothetical protein